MRYCPKSFIDERIVGRHDGAFEAKGVQSMKKYNSIIYIVSLACAGLIFTGCATNQATAPIPANSGRLLVYRVANFGSDLVLVVSIDGKDVATLTEGRNYNGYLSAGQHQITARVDPYSGRYSSYAKNPDDTSWADLLLHRRLVGRQCGFRKEPGSVGASLLNRKVYLVGAVNLAVACWVQPCAGGKLAPACG